MFLATLYPLCVWLLVFRHRRTWRGLLIAAAGVAFGFIVAFIFGSFEDTGVLAVIVRFEAVLVTAVSLWLWSMRRAIRHVHCASCRYDLRGLNPTPGTRCPECGEPWNGAGMPRPPSQHFHRSLLSPRPPRSPAPRAVQDAEQQHPDRKPGDQQHP